MVEVGPAALWLMPPHVSLGAFPAESPAEDKAGEFRGKSRRLGGVCLDLRGHHVRQGIWEGK